MLTKILASVSAAALVAGAASALDVLPNVNGTTAGFAVPLAAELDFAGGAVETTTHDELQFSFFPTGGVFPTGNVVLRVEVSGAEFQLALDGSEVTTNGTSVVSTGGVAGGTVVNFLLSDTSLCNNTGNCTVDLPLTLTSGDVSVAVGLETDAGVPVDNSSLTNLVTADLAFAAPAFKIGIAADALALSEALLPVAPGADPFVILSDSLLGTITAATNTVDVNPGVAVSTVAVRTDLIGTAVNAANADVDSVTVVVAGDMDTFTTALGGSFELGGVASTVSVANRTATRTSPTLPITFTADANVDTVTTIDRSNYVATVTIDLTPGSALTQGATLTGSLESISREGTEIVFPWTQSATQGAASGATSVFRIGNLSDLDAGAVFAEVRNSSNGAFTSTGIEQIAASIDAGGEFVINSTALEAALGDYGRGDLSFVIEADDATLTGRQFVVRNGNIQQVIGGTVQQDQN